MNNVSLFPQITDINDPNYLYPENVFANSVGTLLSKDSDCNHFGWSSSIQKHQELCLQHNLGEEQVSQSDLISNYLDNSLFSEIRKPNHLHIQEQQIDSQACKQNEDCVQDKDSNNKILIFSPPTLSDNQSCHKLKPVRKDVRLKPLLRMVRKYFRDIFKSQNAKIVRKRYINCRANEISLCMEALLAELFPQLEITEDLIYYTMGILNLRTIQRLSCNQSVKDEISDFQLCCKKFSQKRLTKAMQSKSLKVLCGYLVENCEDPKMDALREELGSEQTK
ncbi:unnamed protein product [Moneuplotes crassus]|uniref:Uncharacterized protein n=1 Tax=Euplotes crassus TaxID=5936 RepID=A0AAD1XNS8_EUPCR|nr:unnamed protein product [Moneuplotes crassus]